MADPSLVTFDFLLALQDEAVAADLRAEGPAEETLGVSDQSKFSVAVATLIEARRLLHDRALPTHEARTCN
jgi:hypothetical protein